MRIVNQDLSRLRQPNLLPFSACLRCYLGNFGYMLPTMDDRDQGIHRHPRPQSLRQVVRRAQCPRRNLSNAKGIEAGVSEYRLDFSPGYRIYFGKDGDTLIILLGGGTKKRQQKGIEAAQDLWQEYKQHKRQET